MKASIFFLLEVCPCVLFPLQTMVPRVWPMVASISPDEGSGYLIETALRWGMLIRYFSPQQSLESFG